MEFDNSSEILHDFAPRLRVYKNGRVERLLKDETVPANFDPKTRVYSKDVVISDHVSARIYLPESSSPNAKLPLLIYIHGGAFCLYSAFSSIYHNYLNALVSEAKAIAVSVDYRLAPEHPMPACYEDVWVAMQWVAAHAGGSGPEPWLNCRADFSRVYLAGDSAGANIAHDVAVLATGSGIRVEGLALVHPFFGEDGANELWDYLYPTTSGESDPKLNPAADPARLRRDLKGCKRVMVCIGGKDFLKERGVKYYEVLKENQEGKWEGEVEFMESKGRGHVFHLYKPNCAEAAELLKRVASFIGAN